MQPIDALTENDKELLQAYLSFYGNVECGPINQVFHEWNKNKRTLFKALGKKLTVSKRISIPKTDSAIYAQVDSIYHPYVIATQNDIRYIKDYPEEIHRTVNNDFIADLLSFWVNQNYQIQDLNIITRLFFHRNIIKGYVSTVPRSEPYHCQSFKCTIKNGMKTIRTIQKVLKATNYPRMHLFEKWRDEVNLIQMNTDIQANLVVSIHPIDFISMSDNACNWRSCMSWSNQGCYSSGTLEMMNSNIVAVAYLESEKEFNLELNETHSYLIPNKSWRSLVYIHKDIILCGKSYPYENFDLSKAVLDMVRELVGNNLKWSYQFINQEYHDMEEWNGNYFIRDWFDLYHDSKRKHHSIFFYTHGMYNDIIESHQTYWCCRNYVEKSKKICLSGPATCICCGERLQDSPRDEIYSYDDLGKTKVCYDCQSSRRCYTCGKIKYHFKYHTKFGNFCSDECIADTIIFTDLRKRISGRLPICRKEDLQFGFNGKIVIFFNPNTINRYDILDLQSTFRKIETKEEENEWIRNVKKRFGDDISLYKVPYALSNYQYADVYPEDNSARNHNTGTGLCIYERGHNRYDQIEDRILKLRERMPLLDYMKMLEEGVK